MQRIITRKTIEIDAVRTLSEKERLGLSRRNEAVRALQDPDVSQRRGCFLVGQPRRTLSSRKHDFDKAPIANRQRTLADERPRYGWRRLLIMIRREALGSALKSEPGITVEFRR